MVNEAAGLHFTALSATSLKTEGFLHIFTKYLWRILFCVAPPYEASPQIFFYEKNEQHFVFVQIEDEVLLPDCVIYPVSMYKIAEKYAEQWRKPHEFYEYLRVDESYFHTELMELLSRKSPKNE